MIRLLWPARFRLRNFVCGWFDEKDYFEFRPADVVLKTEKVEKVEMRKYIPRF